MRNLFLVVLLTMGLIFAGITSAQAIDQCEVMYNSYVFEVDGVGYALSDWTNVVMFSPAPKCGGKVTLTTSYGDSFVYDWAVTDNGLVIAGLLAKLTDEGLVLYLIPGDLYRTVIGGKVYMTEKPIGTLLSK